jgi:hypothetical protein
LSVVSASGQFKAPEFVNYARISDTNFAVAYNAFTTNSWTRVEVSSNLISWQPIMNLFTSRTNSIPCSDVHTGGKAICFYRVVVPGTTVEQARTIWQSQNITNYRYHLIGESGGTGGVSAKYFSGTVTVQNGVKTITDATDPVHNSEPVPNPDPADFPTFDEMFDLLEQGLDSGSPHLQAHYDPVRGYPLHCFVYAPRFALEVTSFEVLTSTNSPPGTDSN